MGRRKLLLLVPLCLSVVAPLVLYTDLLSIASDSIPSSGFGYEAANLVSTNSAKEQIGIVYSDNARDYVQNLVGLENDPAALRHKRELKSRVLSQVATEEAQSETKGLIQQVISGVAQIDGTTKTTSRGDSMEKESERRSSTDSLPKKEENKSEKQSKQRSPKVVPESSLTEDANRNRRNATIPDARIRHLKDQLIRAKVYLGLGAIRTNPHYVKELRARIRDVQRAISDATKDSDLPRNANEKLNAMEQALAKGKQTQGDCAAIVRKLRAMLHSAEEQLLAHKKQTIFLTQLAAKTLPKGLHCLPLRLSSQYFSLDSAHQQFLNEEKLENPELYHYALFSDNVLATAVVINSTVSNAKSPSDHVFHIVTDRLNYAAMRMWFLANPPGNATIQVQNIEEFSWLNASYSPVLKQLGSQSMIDYYFRSHHTGPDANLKYRNPKYLSILNHLRFYLPEIYPKLKKIVFLDDDIVVQKDLTGLWAINLKGKVNGAVETCRESFHRFDRYLNFSNPLIVKNFDPRACGWAFGMNIFDLTEWRRQNITEIYHSWQKLNHDRLLWKLGTLPPGLITFWNRTFPLNWSWHVLGLGYNPHVSTRDIERSAVIHYNGNMKPWLEIGLLKYRIYWSKYVNYNQAFLRDCNISP